MSFSLKYRPLVLEDMIGQDAAVLQIEGMFKRDDLPNSILITGPTGSGKTTLARIIARLANDVEPEKTIQVRFKPLNSDCGIFPQDEYVANKDGQGLSVDIGEGYGKYTVAIADGGGNLSKPLTGGEEYLWIGSKISIMGDSKGLCRGKKLGEIDRIKLHISEDLVDTLEINGAEARGIDDVRQLIKVSKYAPKKNFRIYILDEIHQWTPQAKQAFLKVLEEPSKRTLFILCTNEPEKLPNTIIGRCQQIRLSRVTLKECSLLLRDVAKKEGYDFPVDVLKQIAHLTRSHPRDALQALEAVCNYSAGGGDITDAEKLISAIEQVVLVPPSDYLHKYLLSLYRGKYTTALRIVSQVEKVDYFLSCVMDTHKQAMFSLISPKLVDSYSKRWTSSLKENDITKESISIELMSFMLDEMVKSASLVKEYAVEPNHVLVAMTARLVTQVKNAQNNEG